MLYPLYKDDDKYPPKDKPNNIITIKQIKKWIEDNKKNSPIY